MTEKKLDLVVQFRIMPEGAEVDMQALGKSVHDTTKKVAADAQIQNMALKPVAFGLKAIELTLLMTDEAGGPDALEEALNALDGVGSATVTDMGRI